MQLPSASSVKQCSSVVEGHPSDSLTTILLPAHLTMHTDLIMNCHQICQSTEKWYSFHSTEMVVLLSTVHFISVQVSMLSWGTVIVLLPG